MIKHRTRAAALALAVVLGVVLACAGIKKGDEVVVGMERAEESAFYLSNAFVKLERANPILEEKIPGIRAAADKIRREAPDKIRSLHRAIDAYSAATPGSNTPADAQTALALVRQLIDEVTGWLTKAAIHDPAATTILKNPKARTTALLFLPATMDPGSIPLAAGFAFADFLTFGTLMALLRVISTSGADLGADAEIIRALYENLKGTWTKTARATPEQRRQLAEAEEEAYASADWQPTPAPPGKKGKK